MRTLLTLLSCLLLAGCSSQAPAEPAEDPELEPVRTTAVVEDFDLSYSVVHVWHNETYSHYVSTDTLLALPETPLGYPKTWEAMPQVPHGVGLFSLRVHLDCSKITALQGDTTPQVGINLYYGPAVTHIGAIDDCAADTAYDLTPYLAQGRPDELRVFTGNLDLAVDVNGDITYHLVLNDPTIVPPPNGTASA